MADNDRPAAGREARLVDDGENLVDEEIEGIILAPVRIAHARQVERRDPPVFSKKRREGPPPVAVGPAAMDEQEPAPAWPAAALAPGGIADARAGDLDRALLRRRRDRSREPFRRRRLGAPEMGERADIGFVGLVGHGNTRGVGLR